MHKDVVNRGVVKRLVCLISIGAATCGIANASEFKASCTRGDDQRVVEVVAPGEVGAACDVRYFRGANRSPSVPFHANNAQDFCLQKANELVNTLTTGGFTCASVATPDVAATQPSLRAEESSTQAVASADAELIAQAVEEEAPAQAAAEPTELEEKMTEILSLPPQLEEAEPQQAQPLGEPAILTQNASETLEGGGAAPVVGRIVGATPDEPKAVAPITQAAMEENIAAVAEKAAATTELVSGPEPVEPAEPVEAESEEPAEKPKQRNQLRSIEDVVRATLSAQAAAWNEGNIEAFMNGYWKDDGIKYVSNGEITKGWSATQRRYRDRYAADEGLGQLALEKVDVQLVTDDVAVVTGHFDRERGEAEETGVFSLVMRRDRGTWRIVHDHTATRSLTTE